MPWVVAKGWDGREPSFTVKEVSALRYRSITIDDTEMTVVRLAIRRWRSTVSNALVRSMPRM